MESVPSAAATPTICTTTRTDPPLPIQTKTPPKLHQGSGGTFYGKISVLNLSGGGINHFSMQGTEGMVITAGNLSLPQPILPVPGRRPLPTNLPDQTEELPQPPPPYAAPEQCPSCREWTAALPPVPPSTAVPTVHHPAYLVVPTICRKRCPPIPLPGAGSGIAATKDASPPGWMYC